MRILRKSGALSCLAMLGCLLMAGPVLAHHLGADAKVREGKIEVEAFFEDDTPARDAKVQLTDTAQKVIAEGRTDNKGHWSCPVPKPGKYTLIVDAGSGHTAKVNVTVPERP